MMASGFASRAHTHVLLTTYDLVTTNTSKTYPRTRTSPGPKLAQPTGAHTPCSALTQTHHRHARPEQTHGVIIPNRLGFRGIGRSTPHENWPRAAATLLLVWRIGFHARRCSRGHLGDGMGGGRKLRTVADRDSALRVPVRAVAVVVFARPTTESSVARCH
jgi:hypothetical protein